MEPPTIPRMPPRQDGLFWTVMGVNVLRMALDAMLGGRATWVLFGVIGASCVVMGLVLAVTWWRLRRVLRILRRLTADHRVSILNEVPDDSARAYLAEKLDEHGAPHDTGVIERFEFSPVDRRELSALVWLTTIAAMALLVTPLTMELTRGLWIAAFGCGLGFGGAAWLIQRRYVQLSRAFEVSSFGLSEIHPDGSVQRLLWGRGLELHNRPWLRKIELTVPARDWKISIPYGLVGFDRMIECVLVKGGFERRE